jgi:hypothetical protein
MNVRGAAIWYLSCEAQSRYSISQAKTVTVIRMAMRAPCKRRRNWCWYFSTCEKKMTVTTINSIRSSKHLSRNDCLLRGHQERQLTTCGIEYSDQEDMTCLHNVYLESSRLDYVRLSELFFADVSRTQTVAPSSLGYSYSRGHQPSKYHYPLQAQQATRRTS